jgi:glycosyltransferase involved in cell wall biosynthesis
MSRFPDRRDSAAVRTSFGFPPAAPVVAVFARLTRIKGVEYFLEAAAMLKARFEEARFLIVGEDFYEDHRAGLEALARTLGLDSRVVFAGFREDVPDLLREVAVSVLPSLGGEGLPNVVLEAMAAGVPVVATRVGGTPELIEDGIQGLLVPPRDPGALALAIGSLLAEPRRRRSMGQAGRERAGKEFSIEAGVHATETLYERLLTGGRRLPAPSGSPAGHAARARLSPASRPLGDEDRS